MRSSHWSGRDGGRGECSDTAVYERRSVLQRPSPAPALIPPISCWASNELPPATRTTQAETRCKNRCVSHLCNVTQQPAHPREPLTPRSSTRLHGLPLTARRRALDRVKQAVSLHCVRESGDALGAVLQVGEQPNVRVGDVEERFVVPAGQLGHQVVALWHRQL